ncbi:MAG: hypothetical protein ABMA14_17800 [Hyphomonadaceae bacterium]
MHWLKYLLGFLVAALAIVACNPERKTETPAPERPAIVATAPPAADVDPAAYRGAAIAGQVCSQCHDIGLGKGPAVNIGAPDFRKIAKRAESTPEGLAAWMQASHPKMPNYMFEGPDVGDLAAFILSLRQSPG